MARGLTPGRRHGRRTATSTERRRCSSPWLCDSSSATNGGDRGILNVAYCRVSTEERAAEGFSIDGQAEELRAYAELHELGPVMLIEDSERSGPMVAKEFLRVPD